MSVLRRNTRLRREYLYRKNLEGKDRDLYEKKRLIKNALQQNRTIPKELKQESKDLRRQIGYDDEKTQELQSTIDDEYAQAGVIDPKIILTTSHSPSSRLVQFMKELRLLIPNSQRINRGGTKIKELIEVCRSQEFTDIIFVHEHRGKPDALIVCHLPYGPTAYFGMLNCVLRHDLPHKVPNMSEASPHLIFDKFKTKLGERVMTILKYLFPVPKTDSQRVLTFANNNDLISFRNHTFKHDYTNNDVILQELGPRFELKLYQIKLGTVDMDEAEIEWVLRPYMNTAKKRKAL